MITELLETLKEQDIIHDYKIEDGEVIILTKVPVETVNISFTVE